MACEMIILSSNFLMRKERRLTKFILAIMLTASAFISIAQADERMSQIETALSNTTIGGYVRVTATFGTSESIFTPSLFQMQHHRNESLRSQNTSLTPLPPTFDTILNFNTGVITMEIIRNDPDLIQPVDLLPPSPLTPVVSSNFGSIPSFQTSSSLSIQPVPEPSMSALGGLAIGVMALIRLNRRRKK